MHLPTISGSEGACHEHAGLSDPARPRAARRPMRATAPHLPWQAWSARRQYRAELRRLLLVGPHLIEDLGIPVAAAIAEAHKPFWRA